MSSGPLGLAQHLTGGAQSNPETKLRLQQVKEGIHMGQVLSQRCVLESMRDVGLEVWEGSDLVPGQRWANYVLLTAPLSTLAARAELMKMRVTVNPMHGDDDFVVRVCLRVLVRVPACCAAADASMARRITSSPSIFYGEHHVNGTPWRRRTNRTATRITLQTSRCTSAWSSSWTSSHVSEHKPRRTTLLYCGSLMLHMCLWPCMLAPDASVLVLCVPCARLCVYACVAVAGTVAPT